MKVAVVQMVSSPDVQENLKTAQHLVLKASQGGAELVVLPEYFCGMGYQDTDKLAWAETLGQGSIQAALAHWAKSLQIWLVAGTIPIQTVHPRKVHNTCMLFNPQGERAAYYDKIHLFRFSTETEHYDETAVIAPGCEVMVPEVTDRTGHLWKLGLSVCYDLRFPELYRQHVARGAHILVVPAAFTYTTGQAHWELLLRARAVENQCWVLAAAQGGNHANGRQTWGHSMVIDPWGRVLDQQVQPGAAVIYADLDIAVLQQVRQRLPALEHRCL